MNEAFHLGDRIAVMDQARLLQYAAPAELLTHPAAPSWNSSRERRSGPSVFCR